MPSRSLALLGGAAAALLTAAAVAPPLSAAAPKTAIAYVQGGEVHMVNPDGSGAHALTADHGDVDYKRPRVAADGSVWALHEWDLVHIGSGGGRIGTFAIPVPKDSGGQPAQYIPEFLDLSPDGAKAVWSVTNVRCPDTDPCLTDGITGVMALSDGHQVSEQRGITETSFIDDQRLIGIDPDWGGQTRVSTLTGPSELWYDDRALFGAPWGTPRQPAINADRTRFATLRTVQGVGVGVFIYKIATAATPAGFAVPPQQLCVINNVDATQATPSWSPDGRSLVVAQKDGLAAYDFSAVQQPGNCANEAKFTGLSDKGAYEPDWGVVPGTVPDPPSGGGGGGTTPPAPTPATPAPAGPKTTPAPGPKATPAAAAQLTLSAQRLSAILRSGLKVQLKGAKPGRAKVVVKSGARTVASKAVTIPTSGRLTVTVKLSAAGRKALKKARSATLTVTAGGASATLKVKR